jgi:hypothetical protein
MQTFVPYASLTDSAKSLDRQRLGKQRVEVMQLLKALTYSGGWSNHPATKMWEGHERALIDYGVAICDEWIARGYKDTCRGKILDYSSSYPQHTGFPSWWNDESVHSSHRSNLLRKDAEFYGKFGWDDDPEAPYVWPKA